MNNKEKFYSRALFVFVLVTSIILTAFGFCILSQHVEMQKDSYQWWEKPLILFPYSGLLFSDNAVKAFVLSMLMWGYLQGSIILYFKAIFGSNDDKGGRVASLKKDTLGVRDEEIVASRRGTPQLSKERL